MADEGFGQASLPGQQNLAGDNRALFLKMFGGEVLASYRKNTVMRTRGRFKRIGAGKSHSFPIHGEATGAYHERGEDVLREGGTSPKYLNQIEHDEKVVQVDRPYVVPVFVDQWDEEINHYDTRSEYTEEMGVGLAYKWDLSAMQVVGAGARAAADLTTEPGSWGNAGVVRTDSSFLTNGANIVDTFRKMAELFDKNRVPKGDRFAAVLPETFYLLADENDVVSADFNRNTGGDRGTGNVVRLFGWEIAETTAIGDLEALGNHTAAATGQHGTDYTADFTDVVALFWHRSAFAQLQLRGFSLRSDFIATNRGTLIQGAYTAGFGVLRPHACGIVVAPGASPGPG